MQDTKVSEKVSRYFGILDTRVSYIFEYLDTLFRVFFFETYLDIDTTKENSRSKVPIHFKNYHISKTEKPKLKIFYTNIAKHFSFNWQKQICFWSLWSVVIMEIVSKIKTMRQILQIVLKFLGMVNYVFSLILEQKLVL